MGHLLSRHGVSPDSEKVRAITDMPAPHDTKAVMRFLGMANYLLRFVPAFAETAAPLRELTKSGNAFAWMDSHQAAFSKLEEMLSEAPTLVFFDPQKEATIHTDASDVGIGAVLLQDGRPVACHSHALSSTEQRYATIEKKCLAVVSACLKFDHLLFGKPAVQIFSDHKPLTSIFQKPLESCPRRHQRMRLTLQRYDPRVNYIPGSKNLMADALSRAPLQSRETVLRLEYELAQCAMSPTKFSSESKEHSTQTRRAFCCAKQCLRTTGASTHC